MRPVEEQLALISRGVDKITPEAELRKKLERSNANGKPLRVKLGIDPTGFDGCSPEADQSICCIAEHGDAFDTERRCILVRPSSIVACLNYGPVRENACRFVWNLVGGCYARIEAGRRIVYVTGRHWPPPFADTEFEPCTLADSRLLDSHPPPCE